MAVIPYMYRRLRALGFPHAQAELISDPDNALDADAPIAGDAVEDLEEEAELADAVLKMNELLASLRAAGVIEEE